MKNKLTKKQEILLSIVSKQQSFNYLETKTVADYLRGFPNFWIDGSMHNDTLLLVPKMGKEKECELLGQAMRADEVNYGSLDWCIHLSSSHPKTVTFHGPTKHLPTNKQILRIWWD